MAFEVRTRFVLEYLAAFDPGALAKQHEPIVDAIEQGDKKWAAELLRSHSRGLVRYLEQQMVADQRRIVG
jgi:DNA-binding GntR family transcriptional regulator